MKWKRLIAIGCSYGFQITVNLSNYQIKNKMRHWLKQQE
jgi:hypothetical protein